MPGRVDFSGTSVRRGHGSWWHRKRRVRLRLIAFTEATRGLVRQARTGVGLVGAVACGGQGLERGRCDWSRHASFGPGEEHNDEEPNACAQDQWIENKMRHHRVAPSAAGGKGAL